MSGALELFGGMCLVAVLVQVLRGIWSVLKHVGQQDSALLQCDHLRTGAAQLSFALPLTSTRYVFLCSACLTTYHEATTKALPLRDMRDMGPLGPLPPFERTEVPELYRKAFEDE